MNPEAAVPILAAWDRRKITGKNAKDVITAWLRTKDYREDNYGNFLMPSGQRYHFSKQRLQRQDKRGGRWANVRSTSLIDAATNLLIKSAQATDDTAVLDRLEGARTKRGEQKTKQAKQRELERAHEEVRRIAINMVAAEMPLEFAEWHASGSPPPDIKRAFDMHMEQLEALRRLGGTLPADEDLFNIQEPPFAPLLVDVGPVEWNQPHEGVVYTVTIEKAESRDNVAIIEIGATGDLGQRIDPVTMSARMDVHGMNREGDAYLSGYIQRTDDGALGVLFFIISKTKQRGAGSRILDLWCDLMEAYGSAKWVAEAVGDEGLAFLERKVESGRLESLGGRGKNYLFRCRFERAQQELF
jgi:hypothetical protein